MHASEDEDGVKCREEEHRASEACVCDNRHVNGPRNGDVGRAPGGWLQAGHGPQGGDGRGPGRLRGDADLVRGWEPREAASAFHGRRQPAHVSGGSGEWG